MVITVPKYTKEKIEKYLKKNQDTFSPRKHKRILRHALYIVHLIYAQYNEHNERSYVKCAYTTVRRFTNKSSYADEALQVLEGSKVITVKRSPKQKEFTSMNKAKLHKKLFTVPSISYGEILNKSDIARIKTIKSELKEKFSESKHSLLIKSNISSLTVPDIAKKDFKYPNAYHRTGTNRIYSNYSTMEKVMRNKINIENNLVPIDISSCGISLIINGLLGHSEKYLKWFKYHHELLTDDEIKYLQKCLYQGVYETIAINTGTDRSKVKDVLKVVLNGGKFNNKNTLARKVVAHLKSRAPILMQFIKNITYKDKSTMSKIVFTMESELVEKIIDHCSEKGILILTVYDEIVVPAHTVNDVYSTWQKIIRDEGYYLKITIDDANNLIEFPKMKAVV